MKIKLHIFLKSHYSTHIPVLTYNSLSSHGFDPLVDTLYLFPIILIHIYSKYF